VLNTNTYQKASWVLHMLRRQLGDEIFWKGIRQYYTTFRDSNAMTLDFVRIMQEASRQDLSGFFQQWLYQGGHPVLAGFWRYDAKTKSVVLHLEQAQQNLFRFPLDVKITTTGGQETKQVKIESKKQQIKVPVSGIPTGLVFDPDTWLLFEEKIVKK